MFNWTCVQVLVDCCLRIRKNNFSVLPWCESSDVTEDSARVTVLTHTPMYSCTVYTCTVCTPSVSPPSATVIPRPAGSWHISATTSTCPIIIMLPASSPPLSPRHSDSVPLCSPCVPLCSSSLDVQEFRMLKIEVKGARARSRWLLRYDYDFLHPPPA